MNSFRGEAKRPCRIMSKQAALYASSALLLIVMISSLRNLLLVADDDCRTTKEMSTLKDNYDFMYRMIFEGKSENIFEPLSPETRQLQNEARKQWDCHPRLQNEDLSTHQFPTTTDHPDSVVATISCTPVHYRTPFKPSWGVGRIVFGVLSAGTQESRVRRDTIRRTWGAKGKDVSVFFVVAGQWENFAAEYNEYVDMIWVDQPELYTSTKSGGLTFKTNTFLLVAHNQIMKYRTNVEFFVKADDDTYWDTERLYAALQQAAPIDIGGKCLGEYAPYRNPPTKHWQSYRDYPFNHFPPACYGGIGYAMSPKFLQCAVGEGHIERFHYMSIEDV